MAVFADTAERPARAGAHDRDRQLPAHPALTRRAEDPGDVESRIAGGLCLAFGAVLTVWAWRSGMRGAYELTQAVLGPTLVSLGIGLLIHAQRIALAGVNPLTRAYGLGGALATVAMLAYFGFFTRPATHRLTWLLESALPFAFVVYWSLPSKWLGGPAYDPLAGAPPRDRREP